MRKTMLALMLLCVAGCAGVRVKTHSGWMGPTVWEATDGTTAVNYYNGDCCCRAEKVLQNLAARANRGELDWTRMADPAFSRATLAAECEATK